MPLSRLLLIPLVLSFAVPLSAQQRQRVEMPKPARDAQAVSVLNQAVATAGGLEAISAVREYRATGTVTRQEEGREVQGAVTIRGSGVAQFRLDEDLPSGNRSESMDSGRATAREEDGSLRRSHEPASFMPGNYALPYRQLVTLLKAKYLNVSYKGIVQVRGGSVHHIEAKFPRPPQLDPRGVRDGYFTKDFFIDATTFQVVMIQDMVPPFIHRTIRYSDYRIVSGIAVPFSIVEETKGTQTRTIRLENIDFNAGLQKSDFDLSAR